MINRLKTFGLVGLASLALAGCNTSKDKTLRGTFMGYDVEVKKDPSRIILSSRSHIITGYNPGPSGAFNEIYLDLNKVNIESPQNELRNNPLFDYANPRSLQAARDSALEQNRGDTQGHTIK